MSDFLKYHENNVLEEARQKTTQHPKIGYAPDNLDDILVFTQAGKLKLNKSIQALMKLGYGDAEELAGLVGKDWPASKRRINEMIRMYDGDYTPQNVTDTPVASSEVPTEVEPTINTTATRVPEPIAKPIDDETSVADDVKDHMSNGSSAIMDEDEGLTDEKATLSLNELMNPPKEALRGKMGGGKFKMSVKGNGKSKGVKGSMKNKMATILTHAETMAMGGEKAWRLLTGDPGVGKTSFVRQFGTLVGVPVIIVEAPHITKEHLINIPFITFFGGKDEKHKSLHGSDETNSRANYKIVNSESNLRSVIKKKMAKTNDDRFWAGKLRNNSRMYNMLQKSKPTRDLVITFRKNFKAILFIDEYFRTDDATIRNILRDTLNGNLGGDPIPENTYLLFASNMDNSDGSFEDPSANTQFQKINFDMPSEDEWKDWYKGKYIHDRKEALDRQSELAKAGLEIPEKIKKAVSMPVIEEDVIDSIMGSLDEGVLGTKDDATGVRLSPRRLEQIVTGVNFLMADVDSKNSDYSKQDAMAVLSFLRTNLKNYKSGVVYEELYDKLAGGVIELMKKRGIKDVSRDSYFPSSDWRLEVASQMKMKIALGDNRQYPFLIGGAPGIGKTISVNATATEFGMPVININAQNISKDQILGLPLEDTTMDDDSKQIYFSEPPLYQQIMKSYNRNRLEASKNGKIIKAENGKLIRSEEMLKDDEKYPQILFIDEFTRPEEASVYNTLRKVILEKDFGGEDDNGKPYKLPEDVIIMGALNPVDEGHVKELTDHMRDVVDVIDAQPSWDSFNAYLQPEMVKFGKLKGDMEKFGMNLGDAIHRGCVTALIPKIATLKERMDENGHDVKVDSSEQPFYWTFGMTDFYVSPRVMDDMMKVFHDTIVQALNDPSIYDTMYDGYVPPFDVDETYEKDERMAYLKIIEFAIEDAIDSSLSIAMQVGNVSNQKDFLGAITELCTHPVFMRKFSGLFTRENSVMNLPLNETLKMVKYDVSKITPMVWKGYLDGITDATLVSQQMAVAFQDMAGKIGTDYSSVLEMNNAFVEVAKGVVEQVKDPAYKSKAFGNQVGDTIQRYFADAVEGQKNMFVASEIDIDNLSDINNTQIDGIIENVMNYKLK